MIGLALTLWQSKLARVVVAVGAVLVLVWAYGAQRYANGVRDTTQAFVAADEEGARDVRKTAEETLRNLVGMSDDDIIDSLRGNGGLREDPE